MVCLVDCSFEPHGVYRAALDLVLAKMAAEDPSFAFNIDEETGQTILHGVSERHLEARINILQHTLGCPAKVGVIQVAYRETLIGKTESRYTYKRVRGGAGEFADVRIAFEPIDYASGFQFERSGATRFVPEDFVKAIGDGLCRAKETGVLAAFPVIGVKATLLDARYHDLDSSILTFDIAARAAFRELRTTGLARILEPICKLLVLTPTEYADSIEVDLGKRDAFPIERNTTQTGRNITAYPRMKMMLGYAEVLRHLTDGRATFELEFECYRVVQTAGSPTDLFPAAAAMRA